MPIASVASAVDSICPKKIIRDIYRAWKSQYQKNFSVVPSWSKPTMKKKGITNSTDDTIRYGTCKIERTNQLHYNNKLAICYSSVPLRVCRQLCTPWCRTSYCTSPYK